jgi:hypothetical protein
MLLPSRSVSRSGFGVPGDWRGAALARAQGLRAFFPARGRPRYRIKRAAPASCPARCFVSRSVQIIHFAPSDKPRVWNVRGSLLLKRICGQIRAEKNSAKSGGYDPKRLARRSLPESKRRGEVWLPSGRTERRTPNAERQTPNERISATTTGRNRCDH